MRGASSAVRPRTDPSLSSGRLATCRPLVNPFAVSGSPAVGRRRVVAASPVASEPHRKEVVDGDVPLCVADSRLRGMTAPVGTWARCGLPHTQRNLYRIGGLCDREVLTSRVDDRGRDPARRRVRLCTLETERAVTTRPAGTKRPVGRVVARTIGMRLTTADRPLWVRPGDRGPVSIPNRPTKGRLR